MQSHVSSCRLQLLIQLQAYLYLSLLLIYPFLHSPLSLQFLSMPLHAISPSPQHRHSPLSFLVILTSPFSYMFSFPTQSYFLAIFLHPCFLFPNTRTSTVRSTVRECLCLSACLCEWIHFFGKCIYTKLMHIYSLFCIHTVMCINGVNPLKFKKKPAKQINSFNLFFTHLNGIIAACYHMSD